VPDEGGAQIATLHDRLYAGALRPHLRSDIPFVPHMTIGAVQDLQFAERLAKELGVGSRTVRGVVGDMELVDVAEHRVRSITTFTLGNWKPTCYCGRGQSAGSCAAIRRPLSAEMAC